MYVPIRNTPGLILRRTLVVCLLLLVCRKGHQRRHGRHAVHRLSGHPGQHAARAGWRRPSQRIARRSRNDLDAKARTSHALCLRCRLIRLWCTHTRKRSKSSSSSSSSSSLSPSSSPFLFLLLLLGLLLLLFHFFALKFPALTDQAASSLTHSLTHSPSHTLTHSFVRSFALTGAFQIG